MSIWGLVQLGLSTVIFLLAATAAKQWGLAPSVGKLVWTLVLYTIGNLIMLRLIREYGMSISLSLSAVIQLVAVNLVAILWFGEKMTGLQGLGIVAAIVAIVVGWFNWLGSDDSAPEEPADVAEREGLP